MTEGIIYKYTSPNGKVYIGQTINERKRFNQHKVATDHTHFHNAIRRYGIDSFKYEVVFRTELEDAEQMKAILNSMERFFIKKYNSTNPRFGYNMTEGGDAGCVGVHHWAYGKHRDQKTRNKISQSLKGATPWNKGVPITEDQRKKNSEAAKKKSVSVYKYETDEYLGTYKSLTEAGKVFGVAKANVSAVAKGKYKQCNGYVFRYTE